MPAWEADRDNYKFVTPIATVNVAGKVVFYEWHQRVLTKIGELIKDTTERVEYIVHLNHGRYYLEACNLNAIERSWDLGEDFTFIKEGFETEEAAIAAAIFLVSNGAPE